ncbi:hypothetical protein Y032_0156g3138 [Ancylostoma ceylanicum]|uniref:Uncharacterized protein n=1 Tax=Ancylostoma ceylanicum TaxID=53326 RepID=A0A016SZ69_9BILA|nr:hypothetical protein Y032_0156g3138 [Ancylostoma ceylanicum]
MHGEHEIFGMLDHCDHSSNYLSGHQEETRRSPSDSFSLFSCSSFAALLPLDDVDPSSGFLNDPRDFHQLGSMGKALEDVNMRESSDKRRKDAARESDRGRREGLRGNLSVARLAEMAMWPKSQR